MLYAMQLGTRTALHPIMSRYRSWKQDIPPAPIRACERHGMVQMQWGVLGYLQCPACVRWRQFCEEWGTIGYRVAAAAGLTDDDIFGDRQ